MCGKELAVGKDNPGIHTCYDLQSLLRVNNSKLHSLVKQLVDALEDSNSKLLEWLFDEGGEVSEIELMATTDNNENALLAAKEVKDATD